MGNSRIAARGGRPALPIGHRSPGAGFGLWLFMAVIAVGCGDCGDAGSGSPDSGPAPCGAGDEPCPGGEVCRYEECVPPPVPCADDLCDGDFWCDVPEQECLPWGVGPGDHDEGCVREVVPGVFFPGIQCEWLGPPPGDPFPDHKNVLSTPMVANLGLGGDPELTRPSIVFVSYNFTDGGEQSCRGIDPAYFGVIRIIDGRTCAQQATISEPTVIGSTAVALGDLDGEGGPEIVAARTDGGLVAFTQDGRGGWEEMWRTPSTFANDFCDWTGPSIHDLDGDLPEIIFYGSVYDAHGNALDEAAVPTTLDPIGVGYIPVIADVDGDDRPELVTGGQIYGWDAVDTQWLAEGPVLGAGGRTAVADLGTYGIDAGFDDRATLDGVAEVVTVNAGILHVISIARGEIFQAPLQGITPGNGGPPTIADFDGDGRAEVASAGGTAYTVFDPDCVVGGSAAFCASGRTDYILWSQPSQDGSSNVTGSSVFDFEGDGRAEVVYADECFTRVYDGASGQVMYSRYRTSCTWYENPVIADVDADYNAEIIIGSNTNCGVACPLLDPIFDGVKCLDDSDCPGVTSCGRETPNDTLGRCRCTADADCGGDGFVCRDAIVPSPAGQVCRAEHAGPGTAFGVRVISDQLDRWVNTRQIWNQHAYAVTNVNDDGTIPSVNQWVRNWEVDGLNNFRQNSPGDGSGAGLSPDLTIHDVKAVCDGVDASIVVEVCNRGTEAVADGLLVAVYVGDAPGSPLACLAETVADVHPGLCVEASCQWINATGDITATVDDDGSGVSENLECHEENNRFTLLGVDCG